MAPTLGAIRDAVRALAVRGGSAAVVLAVVTLNFGRDADASAQETCVVAGSTTPVSDHGACTTGAVVARGEVRIAFSLAEDSLQTVRVDALPGQLGTIRLLGPDGRDIWRGSFADAIESPVLLLAAGRYDMVLSAGATGLIYRVAVTEAAPLPPLADGPRPGQFSGLFRGTGSDVAIAWTVAPNGGRSLWTIDVRAPVGTPAALSLRDEAGALLVSAAAADQAGLIRLADLSLPPGAYTLVLQRAPAGTPLIVTARSDARPANFAAELDEEVDDEHPIAPGTAMIGQLIDPLRDTDDFRFIVPEGSPRLYSVSVSAALGGTVDLAVLDPAGRILAQRAGGRLVSFASLALRPGEHVIRVSGLLPWNATYALELDEIAVGPAGVEVEPNNAALDATPLAAGEFLRGRFDGADDDYVNLGIAGRLQLWEIEATGEGLERLALFDGAGRQVLMTGAPSPAGALRLNRVLLPPGTNVVQLQGSAGGAWLLRATPLGLPGANEEYEPNDDPARALPLAFGQAVAGWFDHPQDRDVYAFHLAAAHRVRISLTTSDGSPVRGILHWGSDHSYRLADILGLGRDAGLAWEGLLPPGDFFIDVVPTGETGGERYTLTLENPSFFDRPTDLEPNDEPWQALASRGHRIAGVLGNDADWFLVDSAAAGGTVTVRADRLSGFIEVRLAHGGPAAPVNEPSVYLYRAGETATFTPPENVPLLLMVRGTAGPYELALGLDDAPETPPVEVEIALDPTPLAAFEPVAQRLLGTLHVRNLDDAPITVVPSAWFGDERLAVTGLPDAISLAAGGAVVVAITIEVPADMPDGMVPFDVGVTGASSDPAFARAAIMIHAGVAPVGAHAPAALPPGLLGGINIAWAALGAIAEPSAAGALIDDVIDVNGARLVIGDAVTVALAGGRPVPVAGVVLQPTRGPSPVDRLARFAVEVSTDGVLFRRIVEATLSPAPREQAFPFDAPMPARWVRLVPLSAATGDPSAAFARLAEFQVIATPDFVFENGGFDIADPKLGGHVVRARSVGDQQFMGEGARWPAPAAVVLPANRPQRPEWVIGFRDGRAAEVSAIVWYPRPGTSIDRRIVRVAVAASIEGPLGPWQDLGILNLSGGDDAQRLSFAGPMWARAVRFSILEPETGFLVMPERIEIRERPGPSILGAWGDLSPFGPFEAANPVPAARSLLQAASGDPGRPTPLALEAQAIGEVQRGTVEAWYAVDLPPGAHSIRATFAGHAAPVVALALVAADGTETAFAPDPADPSVMVAPASPGPWRVRVSQPVASVAIAWDTSGSVAALLPAIERMIRQLASGLRIDRDAVNLLPFRGDNEGFLVPEWTDDRGILYGALHAYPFRDQSSDAESALLIAARALAQRPASRAVVLITDASFAGRAARNEELWQWLEVGRLTVFSLFLPVDADPVRAKAQASLMSDWAGRSGHVSRFGSQGDADLALRRLAAWLDQPAAYDFRLSVGTVPPPPGTLAVTIAGPDAAGDAFATRTSVSPPAVAMVIILDASGSMLQRLGDQRRIDIAKDVLLTLGAQILPAGLPVALRVFGHDRPGSCATELFLPLAPLDRAIFAAAVDRVQSVNLARTSIAASLRAAAGDLSDATGRRVIVLVTDGQETCGGDPLAEIAALRAEGVDVRLNIVGLAIGDQDTRALFETWAVAGGGGYFDAADEAGLREAVIEATALPFEVLSTRGEPVATGTIGGAPIELPAGIYRLRTSDGQEQEVVIRAGEERRVTLTPAAP